VVVSLLDFRPYIRVPNDNCGVDGMMVVLKRYRLKEIVRAVQEHEKKGFECITPIRKVYDRKKVWNYNRSNNDFLDFGGVQEREFYFVRMRKVAE